MPYWKIDEKKFDRNGKEIRLGDILVECDQISPMYFAVFSDDGENVECRDLSCNNVCMCEVEETINLGNYTENLKYLSDEDLKYYFSVGWESANEGGKNYIMNYFINEENYKRHLPPLSKE